MAFCFAVPALIFACLTIAVQVDSSIGNPYTTLKRRYDRLLRAALAVQSAIDDVAQLLERMAATVSWNDPHQTVMFIIICFIGSVVVAVVPWALIQAVGLCYMVSHRSLATVHDWLAAPGPLASSVTCLGCLPAHICISSDARTS